MPLTWKPEKKFLPSREWLSARAKWRGDIVDTIRRWVGQNKQGPYDRVMHNVILRRIKKLESFYFGSYSELLAEPFSAHDGALLIVLPRWKALKLARSLFQSAKCVDEEAVGWFNMDWFVPR
jgi:hypothetical protein